MHSVKVSRAINKSVIGECGGSAADMLHFVPAAVVGRLSSDELAMMLNGLWSACREAKALAMADALNKGAIWDVRRGTLRKIAP